MKIYDSVHGFIHFNELEARLIDSEPFQRLRYIHQLGISYLVYPGGTHTRFEHSLGTMHLATQIFDQIAPKESHSYYRQIVRLAALCHDLGHLPFSHVAEKELLGRGGHEEWTLKIIESPYLAPIWKEAGVIHHKENIALDVIKCALGEEKLKSIRPDIQFSSWDRIYSEIITGDFFGADRMDYLLRDARATGLNYGLFDYVQLIEMLSVVSNPKEGFTLAIEENGIESCEALLLARHFMKQRVYQYPTARAYSFHLARFMKILYGKTSYLDGVENYLSMTEYEVLSALQAARKDPSHPGHLDAESLLDRKKRFQAIHLPETISLQNLQHFKQEAKIPDASIHWELAIERFLQKNSLPILRKNKTLTSSEEFFEIAIPRSKKGWLYLSPEYEAKL